MENLWRENKQKNNKWKKYDYLNGEKENANFECECGKSYKTFPGLYLHFQRSHSQKISTKPSNEECTKKITPSGVVYRYLIHSKREEEKIKESSSMEKKEERKSLFQQFQRSMTRNEISLTTSSESPPESQRQIIEILDDLDSYLTEEAIQQNNDIPVNFIPNYFNYYILRQRNTKGYEERRERRICQILYKFWAWLHQNKHTHLLLQYSQMDQASLD